MLVKLAEAIGRISLAGRELTRLAGYTERVMQLMTVLDDLNKGIYKRTMVNSVQATSENSNQTKAIKNSALNPAKGKIIYKDNIIR